ncbi:MAG: endonuclease/exonuclease/phosphatase family protein [Gemmatimonas sp.]
MTFNIAAGHGDLVAIANVIRASSSDVVALQEVDVRWAARSNFVDQASTLAEQLGMQVRFAPIYQIRSSDAPTLSREYGVALLSKFPIVAFTNHKLTRLSTQQVDAVPALAPGLLDATVNARGMHIRVFNTHLDYRADPAVRKQQVTEMLTIIGAPIAPTLLFGDLNAAPLAPELAPLFSRLRDSWPASGDAGLTYPATEPVKRIDYVLVSSHFRVTAASVPVTSVSDHRPLIVDLVVSGVSRP